MKDIEMYTDGACSGNPGPGGWGVVLLYKEHKKELSGAEDNTTNNRMELLAIIKGFEALKEKCNIKLYSDSSYALNPLIQGWLTQWQMNNWRSLSKTPVKNVDLWEKLIDLMEGHNIEFIWVKGHADNKYNNRCDELARKAIESLPKNPEIIPPSTDNQ